jgi:hypothetical protein
MAHSEDQIISLRNLHATQVSASIYVGDKRQVIHAFASENKKKDIRYTLPWGSETIAAVLLWRHTFLSCLRYPTSCRARYRKNSEAGPWCGSERCQPFSFHASKCWRSYMHICRKPQARALRYSHLPQVRVPYLPTYLHTSQPERGRFLSHVCFSESVSQYNAFSSDTSKIQVEL